MRTKLKRGKKKKKLEKWPGQQPFCNLEATGFHDTTPTIFYDLATDTVVNSTVWCSSQCLKMKKRSQGARRVFRAMRLKLKYDVTTLTKISLDVEKKIWRRFARSAFGLPRAALENETFYDDFSTLWCSSLGKNEDHSQLTAAIAKLIISTKWKICCFIYHRIG